MSGEAWLKVCCTEPMRKAIEDAARASGVTLNEVVRRAVSLALLEPERLEKPAIQPLHRMRRRGRPGRVD